MRVVCRIISCYDVGTLTLTDDDDDDAGVLLNCIVFKRKET